MCFVNPLLRFGLCQRLHIRVAVDVRGHHNFRSAINAEVEDRFEDMHHEVHRRDVVVVDDDFVERLEFGLGFFDDFDFGEDRKRMKGEGCRMKVLFERGKRKEIKPRVPTMALKDDATTTVGNMNGIAVSARRMDLPGKS